MRAAAELASAAVLLSTAALLQGCGGGGGPSPSPTPPSPPPAPGPAPPAPLGPLQPLTGVSYVALPCTNEDAGRCQQGALPSADLMQEGYTPQWGAKSRDDLGTIQQLGGNAVRLYAALGIESDHDHGAFLDRAKELGVHVLAGFYTPNLCPDFDCFDAWKQGAIAGFKKGFAKDGKWHPAVSTVVIVDEPDLLNFGGNPPPSCPVGQEAKCRVKAALSALDGVLAAEKEYGVDSNGTNLTVVWSSNMQDSIDGTIKQGIGYFGFQDMKVGTADPSIAGYSPQTSNAALKAAFDTRWVHGMSTHSPWSFVKEKVLHEYEKLGFGPTPWFIGEYRGSDEQTHDDIKGDLTGMLSEANKGGLFQGTVFYQFQTAYEVPGTDLYGMFGLGNTTVTPSATGDVCAEDVNTRASVCDTWDVYCLDPSAGVNTRASAAAEAWGGKVAGPGLCSQALTGPPALESLVV